MEAIACREAVALAEDLNQPSYIVSSDCKQVVDDLAKGSQGAYGAIIREIRHRVPSTSKFIFEGRAANVEAHKLAKYALSLLPGRHVWLGQPHDQTCIPLSVDFE